MKFKYLIVAMEGDILGCNNLEVAKKFSEEELVVDVENGVLLGTSDRPETIPIPDINEEIS